MKRRALQRDDRQPIEHFGLCPERNEFVDGGDDLHFDHRRGEELQKLFGRCLRIRRYADEDDIEAGGIFFQIRIQTGDLGAFEPVTEFFRMPRQIPVHLDAEFRMQRQRAGDSLSQLARPDDQAVPLVVPLFADEPQPFAKGHAGEAECNQVEQPKIQEYQA